ncbi:MAG: SDR family oxidoreductase [Oscillatoria sp. SIO1A7]|nr:SDR family oxidoreductase [Oscillatoria sp. SIO1A7]
MPTALITGASGGIGAVFARELADRQMNLILVARSQAKLEELATQLRKEYKIRVEVLVKDLLEPGAATAVFEAVSQKGLTVDLLINNAGFGDYGTFAERPLPKLTDMMQLNIIALVELTRLFLPAMQQRRSGSIINVSSIAGFQPLPYMSVYAATKAFVLNFSEALWAENRPLGIRVQALCPGPTKTNFFQMAEFPQSNRPGDEPDAASPEEVVRQSLKALENNESTVVTGGLKNQVIVNLHRFFPRDTLASAMEKPFRNLGSKN